MTKIRPETTAPHFLIGEIEDSPTDDCILCLFNSQEITIIREALFPVSSWKTRLGEWSGRLFDYSTDNTKRVWFRELCDLIDYKLSGGQMTTCFDAIKDGLDHIAHHLADISINLSCGDNVQEVNTNVTDGGNVVTGTPDEFATGDSGGEGDPPDGYDTWEEYYTDKCRKAYALVDGMINNLNTFSIMTVVTFVSISAGLGIFWAALPGGLIITLVVALAVLGVGRMYLSQISDYLSARREEIVCAIYNSTSTGEAIDQFVSYVDDAIEDLALMAPLPGQLKSVVMVLCDAGAFSKVFTVGLAVFYPDADCSGCVEEDGWHFDGTLHGFTQQPEITGGGGITSAESNVVPSLTSWPGSASGPFADGWIPFSNGQVLQLGNYDYEIIITNTLYWTGQFRIWVFDGQDYILKVDEMPPAEPGAQTGTFNVEEEDGVLFCGLYVGWPASTYWTKLDFLKLTFVPA